MDLETMPLSEAESPASRQLKSLQRIQKIDGILNRVENLISYKKSLTSEVATKIEQISTKLYQDKHN
jgi:hypothetical protein